jgi:uncharacterized repeat protein (TIGR03803 family)
MFKGRDFTPGETVTFQVSHVHSAPDQGPHHTPMVVVADPSGAFVATWLVCGAQCCAGKPLQIEATGQTSGKIARAIFMDMPAPPGSGASAQAVMKGRALGARANTANTAAAPTFERIKSFGAAGTGIYPFAKLMQGTDGALYGTTQSGGTVGYGTVFKMNPDGSGFAVLKNFDYSTTGAYPIAGLVQGTDGALYGTAYYAGPSGYGTVFKLNTDGTGFAVLQSFDYSTTGAYPYAGLVLGTDGVLYGTAGQGGSTGSGTVFKLNTDGTGFAVLQNFDYSTTGANPYGGLAQGTDGALYGTAQSGGNLGFGTVFKLNTDGSGFTVLQDLDYSTTGAYPYFGSLERGTDGALYGTTNQGGTSAFGTVFKLNPDGSGFTVLHNFDYSAGAYPSAGPVQGTDGALYGTTYYGGTSGYGTAFKLNTDGTGFTVLQNFDYSTTGAYPYAGLVQATNGALYGTAYQGGGTGFGTVFKLSTDGTVFAVLKNFSNGSDLSEGAYPYGGVMQGTDGALYGTTYYGGTSSYGTVFKLNTDGTGFNVRKNFDYTTTGGYVFGGLLQGTDGALYGTAQSGGTFGAGTLFKLNPDGTGFTVLKNFDYSTSGGYPFTGRLIQGTDGALYGTAAQGGTGGAGTVFKLNTDGTGFTVLQNFDYSTTGGYLYAGVIQGTDGALYGTTYVGGTSNYYGTVFKLNTNGTGFTVLLNFDYNTNGGYPFGGLIQGTDGALYGTASNGGTNFYGTVFKLNTDGTGFSVLENFDYSTTGGYPYSGLVQRTDGVLYGTTNSGGSSGAGTAFGLNPNGSGFSVLKNFDGGADGGYPYGGTLAKATDGNLYGTTPNGGDNSFGTVFRLIFESNSPPVARCKDVTVSAGAACNVSASIDDGSSDPDTGDTITLAQAPPGPYAIGATNVTLTVTDSHGASSSCAATVTVTNPAPAAAITGPASGSVFAVNTPVAFAGSWTDANGGAHTARWSFDGVPDASFNAGTGASGSANTNHTFTAAGVYMVQLTVTDACGASGSASQVGGIDAMVVVFDPSAGFVTGGGWINSPPGAYTANPALTGKANFGFESKYKKGASAPTGETEFQYKVGNLNFHSTSYQWLVVAGAKAQFKGTGTINNAGTYGFILTAIDGEISGGGGADKFRMKITGSGGGLVYDNLLNAPDADDPTTLLGGGSIVIHSGGSSASAGAVAPREEAALPAEFALAQNFPNPFDRSTVIGFSLPERSSIRIAVYDLAGREVRRLADGAWDAGRHSATLARTDGEGRLGSGVYFVRMSARSLTSDRTFSSLRKLVLVD